MSLNLAAVLFTFFYFLLTVRESLRRSGDDVGGACESDDLAGSKRSKGQG